MTIKNVYNHFLKSLAAIYEKSEAENIARWVLEDRLGISSTEIILKGEETISEVKANDLAWKLMRLMKGEPVQYVLGYAFFHGLKLKVNKSVLIPRPETEELVEWILEDEKKMRTQWRPEIIGVNSGAEKKILDIGTGSGCIAIVLKKKLKDAEVYGIDISEGALKIAHENAGMNEVQISFLQGDILVSGFRLPTSDFRLIISNPPYVLPSEKISLHKNVLEFEPHEALFVPENDPLIFYRAIIEFANQNLAGSGSLYFEVNPLHAKNIAELLRKNNYQKVEVKKDLSGNERMVKGTKFSE